MQQEQWQHYRQHRLTSEDNDKVLTFDHFQETIEACRERELTDEQKTVLNQLEQYVIELKDN